MTLPEKIAKACLLDGELTPMMLMCGLETGKYQQFAKDGTVLLTSLVETELGAGCRIVLAAGDFKDVWALHDEQAEVFAREKGRKYMIGQGRPAWARSASQRGYKSHGYRINAAGNEVAIMVKDIEGAR